MDDNLKSGSTRNLVSKQTLNNNSHCSPSLPPSQCDFHYSLASLFLPERPVLNESQAVTVKFGLTLQQIMDVVRLYKLWQDSVTIKSKEMFSQIFFTSI